MEVRDAILNNDLEGLQVSPAGIDDWESKPAPELSYDDAAEILQFIVDITYDIDVALFTTWIYDIASKRSRRKTTINGHEIPEDQAELAALLVSLMENQNESGAGETVEAKSNESSSDES
ncbi:hypothetical protein [Chromohalobacter sp. 48-RD10]|uniref:hypothetical protein n=1 Tax=Chromohalobacter sp. 48-RD10 TaxID=2994063 RepID=UPI002468A1C4|nr:hypothetical protein [Chromohalobacter sp. 48-RD10]